MPSKTRNAGTHLRDGLRGSIRNNYTAYGFSVMITASFGVTATLLNAPAVGEVFMFLAGAVAGFTAVEAVVSGGFRHGPRGESSDIVALGTAFSFLSVGSAVGAAALVATVIDGSIGWFVAPFGATVVYVLGNSLEMAFAHALKEGGVGDD